MATKYSGNNPHKVKSVASVLGAPLRVTTNNGKKYDVVPRWFGSDMPHVGETIAVIESRAFVREV